MIDLQKTEEKTFYEEIRLIFLYVIRTGLKNSHNPEIKQTTKNIMEEFKMFDKKYEI